MKMLITLLTALTVVQCALMDILASQRLPPVPARLVVALNAGQAARLLAAPAVGRIWAVVWMAVVAGACLALPTGWGLAGLLLVPPALSAVTFEPHKEKRND